VKIAIINDTHFGVRNDSPFFLEHILSFFQNKFIPYLIANKIDTIIHLGDFFDRRKYINFNTLSSVRKRFIEPLVNANIKTYITLGNHDTYYRNTNDVNSIKELFQNNEHFVLIDTPTDLTFENLCMTLVPWITQENHDSIVSHIKNSSCRVIGGHFEIVGFQVVHGVKHSHGLSVSDFNKFEMVLSGHFHLKQSDKNIFYLGSQYQMNFGDVNYKKGFHVLDTNTMELLFIENENSIFHIFNYDDSSDESVKDIARFVSRTDIKGSFIRIFIREKTKQKIFDKFIDALYDKGVQDISIIEDNSISNSISSIDTVEGEDTMSIIYKEIDNIQKDVDKTKLKTIMKDLYMESLSL